MKNIYVFGSVVRGEIDQYSDVDLLLITDEKIEDIDPNKYSIYTPQRIQEMYKEGNPFAWHLHYESKLVYTNDTNFLEDLKSPEPYKNGKEDLIKFQKLFVDSLKSIEEDEFSLTFDLAMIFLAIRNFATCYSLACYDRPIFSRTSFEKLTDFPLVLDDKVKNVLMRSRINSTRGINYNIQELELSLLLNQVEEIKEWFNKIIESYESRI